MPFTLSHSAVVVPIARLRLSLSALVIGSMAPDFEYFLTLSGSDAIGHSISGIVLFCIPLGFLVLVLFYKFIKLPLISLCPNGLQKRLVPLSNNFHLKGLKNFSLIILSLFIGSVSHLSWDSLIDPHGLAVHIFPSLRHSVHLMSSNDAFQICRIIQHVSTVVGIFLIAIYLIILYKKTSNQLGQVTIYISAK